MEGARHDRVPLALGGVGLPGLPGGLIGVGIGQVLREENVGQFGMGVGAPRLVGTFILEIEIFEVHGAETHSVSTGRHVDDSGILRALDHGEEESRQQVVPEMVDSKVLLVSLGGRLPFGESHDACVVEEDV